MFSGPHSLAESALEPHRPVSGGCSGFLGPAGRGDQLLVPGLSKLHTVHLPGYLGAGHHLRGREGQPEEKSWSRCWALTFSRGCGCSLACAGEAAVRAMLGGGHSTEAVLGRWPSVLPALGAMQVLWRLTVLGWAGPHPGSCC